MKRILVAFLSLLLAAGALNSAVTLDPQVWGIPINSRAGGPTGGQFTCIKASQVALSAGVLTQTATWAPSTTCSDGAGGSTSVNVISGMIYTRSFVIPAGVTVRIDGRMKFGGTGVHSTFWTFDARCLLTSYVFSTPTVSANCGNLVGGTQASEIDIGEAQPGAHGNTVQIDQVSHLNGQTVVTTTISDYSQNFHTYSAIFTPGVSIQFLVDNVNSGAAVTTTLPVGPMFLIIDQEVDASACSGGGNNCTSGNYPQTLIVNFIRVGTSTGALLTPATANIFDEEFTSTTYSAFQGFTP